MGGGACQTCDGTGIGACPDVAEYVEIKGGCPRCRGTGRTLQTWTFWEDERDGSNLLIPGDALPAHEQGRCIATFQATDPADAARQRNEFMGWEPYKPMDGE